MAIITKVIQRNLKLIIGETPRESRYEDIGKITKWYFLGIKIYQIKDVQFNPNDTEKEK